MAEYKPCREYYTYIIYNCHENPIYVGQGKGKRRFQSLSKVQEMVGRAHIYSTIDKEGLTIGESMDREAELIAKFGRQCEEKGGTLLNKSVGYGGTGVTSTKVPFGTHRAEAIRNASFLMRLDPVSRKAAMDSADWWERKGT